MTPDLLATLAAEAAGRWRVNGALVFTTVSGLLPAGRGVFGAGDSAVIDLQGVTAADSAGLALLIEWLSEARAAGCNLRYENMPVQLQQLARLSEVETLFGLPAATAPVGGAGGAGGAPKVNMAQAPFES